MKHKSLFFQLIIGFSAILFVVLSVTSYFSYRYSSQVVLNKTTQYLLESIIQMRGKTDVMLREYDRLSQMVALNDVVQQYFIRLKNGQKTLITSYEIERYIKEQSRYIGTDFFIQITDYNGDSYSGNNSASLYPRTEKELQETEVYPFITNNKGRLVWVSGYAWRNGKLPAVVGARQINNRETFERLGNMFLVFPVARLQRIIGDVNVGKAGKIQIIDRLGTIVYSTIQKETGQKLDGSLLQKMSGKKNSIVKWEADNIPTYISYSVSDYSGWTVAAYIDEDESFEYLKKMQTANLIIGLFSIGAALLFTAFFSWSLVRPIRHLAMRLNRIERGVLTPYRGTMINREVATLYDSFNQMVENLNSTVKDLSDKQISEKQAQIVALKAQFRPHFLYNSLNTIYWSLINEGQDKVANMVLTLSDLLRYSIQPGSEMVTIKEDLDQLRRFVDLQQARYGDKLNVDVKVQPELFDYRMMKLMLQPLVENAISHGLEQVKGRIWKVIVEIYEEDNNICFIVEDNGIGMTREEMDNVLNFRGDTDVQHMIHTGLGLANLHYRIGLVYGKEYGIQLSEGQEGGLKVEIKVPLRGGNAR